MTAGHEQAKSGRLMEGKGQVHNWEETGYFRKTWAEFQFPDLPAEDHRFRDRLAPFPLLPPGGSELLQCSLPWLLSIASWVCSIRTCPCQDGGPLKAWSHNQLLFSCCWVNVTPFRVSP